MTFKEYFAKYNGTTEGFGKNCPRVFCNDGYNFSAQASSEHYCYPRVEGLKEYEKYEIGFPSESDSLIMDYCEDYKAPTKTVYAKVPLTVIEELVKVHGGLNMEYIESLNLKNKAKENNKER